MLKFGDKTVKTMEFYTNATPLNIEKVNIENLVLSDPIPANKDKDERFVIGYQNQDGNYATLLLKTPEKVYSKGVSCYSEGSALTMSFDLYEYPEWVENYEKILIRVASLGGHLLTNTSVKKGRYLSTKFKMWDGKVITNIHKKKIPEDGCICKAIVKLGSIYRQSANYYVQTYLEECKYKEVDRYTACHFSDSDEDEGFTVL